MCGRVAAIPTCPSLFLTSGSVIFLALFLDPSRPFGQPSFHDRRPFVFLSAMIARRMDTDTALNESSDDPAARETPASSCGCRKLCISYDTNLLAGGFSLAFDTPL